MCGLIVKHIERAMHLYLVCARFVGALKDKQTSTILMQLTQFTCGTADGSLRTGVGWIRTWCTEKLAGRGLIITSRTKLATALVSVEEATSWTGVWKGSMEITQIRAHLWTSTRNRFYCHGLTKIRVWLNNLITYFAESVIAYPYWN